ncbi:MAG: hypothetical protein MJZ84_05490 [Paludibacteraceae bacterium]|nr:hypothetical protein [Paludibacteraceae bacterium]
MIYDVILFIGVCFSIVIIYAIVRKMIIKNEISKAEQYGIRCFGMCYKVRKKYREFEEPISDTNESGIYRIYFNEIDLYDTEGNHIETISADFLHFMLKKRKRVLGVYSSFGDYTYLSKNRRGEIYYSDWEIEKNIRKAQQV